MTPAQKLIAAAKAAAAANRQSLMRRTVDARVIEKVKTATAKG